MAENTDLDAFLKGDAPVAVPGSQSGAGPGSQSGASPAPVETPKAEPEPKGEAAAKPAAEPKPEPEVDDDGPFIEDATNFRKLREIAEATKKERQDWKAKAVRAETERDALQKQLAEATKPANPAPPPVQPREIPNPAHDPAGYHAYVQQEQAHAQINHLLNVSEMMAIKEHGAEKVAAMKAEFLAAKDADPTLGEKLIQQPDPYGWAMAQIEKIRAMRDIGDDPAAYRARIIAEHEAARAGEQQPARVSPAAGMAPSLASVRSVAGRSAPAFSGPPSLDDIVASIHQRK
jgi:hypothetical protein